MTVPPRPEYSPFQPAADNMNTLADQQKQGRSWGNGTPPGQRQSGPKRPSSGDTQPVDMSKFTAADRQNGARTNAVLNGMSQNSASGHGAPNDGAAHVTNKSKTRNGGGFNPSLNPTLNITVPGGSSTQGGAAPAGHGGSGHGGSVPGADFQHDEDIRAYCEFRRKQTRNEATELAMDADHLEAVLKTIPDSTGSRAGSRARARRVSRWLKKAAAAEKAQQKYFAMLYGTFQREFETELHRVSPGRPKQRQNVRAPFQFGR